MHVLAFKLVSQVFWSCIPILCELARPLMLLVEDRLTEGLGLGEPTSTSLLLGGDFGGGVCVGCSLRH